MKLRALDERGLTLTEVTIVAAMGLLVLLGLGGFYLNSQSTWLDASSQSITQREATLVTEAIADSALASAQAIAIPLPDADHGQIVFYRHDDLVTPSWCFWWDPADSLIHHGADPTNDDRGALLSSKVERFRISADSSFVQVDIRLRAATGQRVEIANSTLLRNR
jgi:hypothetical protein